MERLSIVRPLRIATSAAFLLVCALWIALWARSYYWVDNVIGRLSNTTSLDVGSAQGQLAILAINRVHVEPPFGHDVWTLKSVSLDQVPEEIRLYSLSNPCRTLFHFGRHFEIDQNSVRMPHWFLVMTTGVTATVLAIRRPWRFSLRTLLIVMTLVAVALGTIVAFAR
jgi:hypothetical protein